MPPRVSVVVPAHNLARFLPAALDSALGRDWPVEALDVIVVDDGSTDATPQVLERYRDRVTVVRQANAGLVRAPAPAIPASCRAAIVVPPTSSSHLGVSSPRWPSRLPRPAASTTTSSAPVRVSGGWGTAFRVIGRREGRLRTA